MYEVLDYGSTQGYRRCVDISSLSRMYERTDGLGVDGRRPSSSLELDITSEISVSHITSCCCFVNVCDADGATCVLDLP